MLRRQWNSNPAFKSVAGACPIVAVEPGRSGAKRPISLVAPSFVCAEETKQRSRIFCNLSKLMHSESACWRGVLCALAKHMQACLLASQRIRSR